MRMPATSKAHTESERERERERESGTKGAKNKTLVLEFTGEIVATS